MPGSRPNRSGEPTTLPWARSCSGTCCKSTEMVDVPLDRLEAVGRADMDRNLAALKEACAEYARGHRSSSAFDRMNAHKPAGGAG